MITMTMDNVKSSLAQLQEHVQRKEVSVTWRITPKPLYIHSIFNFKRRKQLSIIRRVDSHIMTFGKPLRNISNVNRNPTQLYIRVRTNLQNLHSKTTQNRNSLKCNSILATKTCICVPQLIKSIY